jgi:hypothetical protein
MNHQPTKDDLLKAENALLKLKLEMDHGMMESDTSFMTPQLENLWLNSIFNFEKNAKDAPRITLHQLLGEPQFPKAETLSSRETSRELERLTELMHSKSVVLDCCKPQTDAVIYKFITEELFNAEVISMPGTNMVMHFIYEEFHDEGS